MPATSVDTFFACSLMVLLVLSAMAGASKILYPQISNSVDEFAYERYMEISKHLLLNSGEPADWGQDSQVVPEKFGLAEADAEAYTLDIDKVSRLNSENRFSLSYAQMFASLKISDVSFRIEIEPIFEVSINLTATFHAENDIIYQFGVSTEKHGVPVDAELKFYVVAENHFEANQAYTSNGMAAFNVTIPEDVGGPALLVVFAKAVYNARMVSFSAYAFEHNLGKPQPVGTFLRLSPLNHTLEAFFGYQETTLTEAYALTFNYSSTLAKIANDSQLAMYRIPCLQDSSPILLVVTGRNSTSFFAEWVSYPQVPLQTGANFENSTTISNIFTYSYIVTINNAFYQCKLWLGGPKR
ncbi:MAG: hypothetical protein ACPLZC_02590 [Candidatus Bathyarchaeales archaeon]